MLFIGSCQHLSHFALLSAPGALKRYGIKRPVYRKGAWIIGKKKGTGAAMQDRLWHWKIGQPSKETMNPQNDKISRVYRSKAQAKESYDRISRFYDHIAGTFEKRHRNKTLERLNIRRGDTVLEIGFGTGHFLKQIADSVGENGRVYGIDISSGMLKVSKQRLDAM